MAEVSKLAEQLYVAMGVSANYGAGSTRGSVPRFVATARRVRDAKAGVLPMDLPRGSVGS